MRVLFLTHRLPYAANRGDRLRALHILKLLRARGDVDLLSFVHDRDEEQHAADLAASATTVTTVRLNKVRGYTHALAALATDRPLTHAILDAPELRAVCLRLIAEHPPDVILAYCSGMARFALEEPLKAIPFVLDMVDVDSEKWRAMGRTGSLPRRWIYTAEGRRLSAFEARAAGSARAVLVVNERERASMQRLAPAANVQVVQNGVDLTSLYPADGPSSEPRVTFCGVMNYPPNAEGAIWFAKSVWPIVRRQRPDARLAIVGSDPPSAVRDLARADPSIEVTGSVPDVRPYLWRSAVGIAPIFIARGVQNKVLEAVAAGAPCIVTPAVRDGLPPEVLAACTVASDADGFASALVALLDISPVARRAIAARARLEGLTWPERLAPIGSILDAVVGSAARTTGAGAPALVARIRPRLLFLSQRVPYPPNRGDKITTWRIIDWFQRRGYDVHCVAFSHGPDEDEAAEELRQRGFHIQTFPYHHGRAMFKALPSLFSHRPLTMAFFGSAALQQAVDELAPQVDLAYAFSSSMGAYLLRHAALPRVMHFAELDSDKWRQYAERSNWPLRWVYAREARTLRQFEERLAHEVNESVFCTRLEQDFFRRAIPGAASAVLSNGVDVEYFQPSSDPPQPFEIVFTGVMNYYPNIDACVFFAHDVLPRVQQRFPDASLTIVGAHPTAAIRRLGRLAGVRVTGFVPDTRDYLRRAALVIAPLRIARGIQNKVLEGMAMGLPVVATTYATQGIDGGVPGRDYVVADGADDQVARICELFADPARAAALGAHARQFVVAHYNWDTCLEQLSGIATRLGVRV